MSSTTPKPRKPAVTKPAAKKPAAGAARKAAPKGATKRASSASTATASTPRPRASAAGAKLVIVESPAKARTIEKYLGRAYAVRASMGHVRDLPKSKLGVAVDGDFEPQYLIPRDKTKTVNELKGYVREAREVILATDPDREGEAIAWHLIAATQAQGKPVQRVVFHEITPDAVRTAMEHPRDIDMNLVDAQQARRVLDRLVGYSISPLLWKKVKRGLSAGRVQSVALRLVVDREREIQEFVTREYWSLDAELVQQGHDTRPPLPFTAGLSRVRGEKADLPNQASVDVIVNDLDGAEYIVAEVQTKETQRRPAAPFTTSTLQQEASRKLNYPVRRTMQIAQELYEGVDLGSAGTQGLITYMRTDSTNIAASAQAAARDAIARQYGAEFVPERPPVYARRAKGAQEAHEAIRPTDPSRHPDTLKGHLTPQQLRLYRLVWQRFIASQMRNAIFDSTTVDIDAGRPGADKPYRFRATGSVIKFTGFLAVYREGRDDEEQDDIDRSALPQLNAQELLDLLRLKPEQHFTQPPPRYSEAALVKALEENGIGRPSTYAPTIATLQARNYVTTEEKRLVPTELGFVVTDIMIEHFPSIVDVGFTSQMEGELDEIASGERAWAPVIREFYTPFAESIGRAEQTMERVKVRDEPTDEICELCGRDMVIKLGRYGRFIACTGFPECRNAKPLLAKIGVTCPDCQQGDIVERRSKKGRVFFGCSRYPDCTFTTNARPTGVRCPVCSGVMIVANRAGTESKCQTCGHREMVVAAPVEAERVALTA